MNKHRARMLTYLFHLQLLAWDVEERICLTFKTRRLLGQLRASSQGESFLLLKVFGREHIELIINMGYGE